MSREVRRVPLDWKHPIEHNPHWLFQSSTPYGMSRPPSRLHGRTERFVGLMADYGASLARWEDEGRVLRDREGWDWSWNVDYHLTGYKGREDTEAVVHPWHTYADDGETGIETTVRDEDHLQELVLAKHATGRPDPTDYMPTFDVPEDQLGWCLYETVSEGTPTTPVFSTAAELIDHLATLGQDYDQKPMRRTAAETLVGNGSSFASMVMIDGTVYDSSTDADLLAAKLPRAAS